MISSDHLSEVTHSFTVFVEEILGNVLDSDTLVEQYESELFFGPTGP